MPQNKFWVCNSSVLKIQYPCVPMTLQVLNYKRVLHSANILEIYRNTCSFPNYVETVIGHWRKHIFFYFFVVYLTMLLIISDYIASGDLTILIMNWKTWGMERSWLNLSYSYEIVLEGLKWTTNNFNHDSQCPYRYSNRARLGYAFSQLARSKFKF
jgi:hypothetical protein